MTRLALLGWFLIVDVHYWWTHGLFWAADVLIYTNAAGLWLAGGDPWSYAINGAGTTFGSTPPTLLVFAPLSFLPMPLVVVLVMGAVVAASVLVLRKLDLPLWWLAFPPLFFSIAYGNIMPILLWLVLVDRPWATALATIGKAYAIIPAIVQTKWRHLLVAGVALAVTAPMWPAYFARGTSLGAILNHNWNGSAWFDPLLLLGPTAIAIAVLRKREGPWLAIPALWIGTNVTYGVFALPALVRNPGLAIFLATPVKGVPPVAAIATAVERLRSTRRPAAPTAANDDSPSRPGVGSRTPSDGRFSPA